MQQELNTKVWQNGKLLPEVRDRLLIIASKFLEYLDVQQQPQDVLFTGSLASYNWTDASDLDLHVVLDFNAIDGGGKLVKDYMLAKKGLWNDHHHVVIKGFPVELYAQDAAEPHYALGIYSVLHDRWVKEPVKSDEDTVDHATVDKKAEQLQYEIAQAVEDQDLSKLETISDKLRKARSEGLAEGGEFSTGNQVFKALRWSGTLDKLAKAKIEIADNQLSLSSKEQPMVVKSSSPIDYQMNRLADPAELETGVGADDDSTGKETTTHEEQQNLMDRNKVTAEEAAVMAAITNIGGADRQVKANKLKRLADAMTSLTYLLGPDTVLEQLLAELEEDEAKLCLENIAHQNGIDLDAVEEEAGVMAAIGSIDIFSGFSKLNDQPQTPEQAQALVKQLKAKGIECASNPEGDVFADDVRIDEAKMLVGDEEQQVMATIGSIGVRSEVSPESKLIPEVKELLDTARRLTDTIASAHIHATMSYRSDPNDPQLMDAEISLSGAHAGISTVSELLADALAYLERTPDDEEEVMATIANIGVQAAPRKNPVAPTAPVAPVEPAATAFDEEQVKSEMAAALGISADDVTVDREDQGMMTVTADGTEYEVMDSEDAAEARATAQVKESLENEPEMFNQEWLQGHLEIYDTDRRIIAGEEADALYDDRDDEEIKEEYEREIAGTDYAPEKLAEGDVEAMREALKDKKSDEVGEELKDPVKYFVTDNGMYSMEDLMKAPFIRIDVDAAAADAVSVDGWPHFLSHYDGNYETTKAGFVYWRA